MELRRQRLRRGAGHTRPSLLEIVALLKPPRPMTGPIFVFQVIDVPMHRYPRLQQGHDFRYGMPKDMLWG